VQEVLNRHHLRASSAGERARWCAQHVWFTSTWCAHHAVRLRSNARPRCRRGRGSRLCSKRRIAHMIGASVARIRLELLRQPSPAGRHSVLRLQLDKLAQ
jgi:hypothetical protein